MGGIIKKVCAGCLLLALLGILLFPRQVLLQCIAWKAESYCLQAFEAQLEIEELVWENGEIVFKGVRLQKEGELHVSFERASLLPFLDWKQRTFGGALNLEQLKIVHCKKENRPIPTPPPPSFKFLTFQLDTTVKNGELLLYDYLARNHFFQKVNFDLTHHVHGKKMHGRISFDWNPDSPPFIAHFQGLNEGSIDLQVHLQQHSCSVLSHLVTYFFHRYVPEEVFQWDILGGKADGDLEMVLVEGVPLVIKGRVDLHNVQAENLPLEVQGKFERLSCDLDVDFSNVNTIQGLFELAGGTLSLESNGEFWRGMCNLEDMHARLSVKEGKLESSTLRGNLMGMEGEVMLDWRAQDALMQINFTGSSKQICSHLTDKVRVGFESAFPNDAFILKASLKRAGDGLELGGTLSIDDQDHAPYLLHFGCMLGSECEREIPWGVPQKLGTTFSQSFDPLFDRLKGQFHLSQKLFGWFEGEGFPLDKFMSPFLFQNIRMQASGLVDFKGTFDHRYLVVFYEGRDFSLESPHFRFQIDRIKEHLASEISAVHYLNLQTWDHLGFLPVKGGKYLQKNYGFTLDEAAALIHFENNTIHIQDINTHGEGVAFHGDVDVIVRSPEDVEMVISVGQLRGAVRDAQKFLAHFKSSFLWEIPLDGEVLGEGQSLYFHYLFSPTAALIEGRVSGRVECSESSPFLGGHPLRAVIDYDCLTQGLACRVTDRGSPFMTVQATTAQREGGKQIIAVGKGPAHYENIYLEVLQNGEESHIAFTCGPWIGGGDVTFHDQEVILGRMTCWADQKRGFSFSGSLGKTEKTVKGELHAFKWDLTSFFEKNSVSWNPHGVVAGSGPLVWNMKTGLCSVEGLEVEIPTEQNDQENKEKYKLGRCHYDLGLRKVHFEGFDFSLAPEKVSWVARVTSSLFPGGIDPALFDCVKSLKPSEPLEGHLSLEVYPDSVWICLNLKDGNYFLGGHQLHLQNFSLAYDPNALNIWTQCQYQDRPYWVHLITDSATLSKGAVSLSLQTLSAEDNPDDKVTARWERQPGKGWCVTSIAGNFCGVGIDLSESAKRDFSDTITLGGHINFDPSLAACFLTASWKEKMESLSVMGACALEGEFTLDKRNLSNLAFKGTLSGKGCHARGIGWSEFTSYLEYTTDCFRLSQCALKDAAGYLSINELIMKFEAEKWCIALDRLKISDLYLSRLKSPWTQWGPRDKPFFRSLYVRSFVLEKCRGDLKDLKTLLGSGKLEFSNIPKKTFLSSLLFLPSEITARIGLDLTALVPARGTIAYKIKSGKVHFDEFKEMYSDGKHSRFYLADGFPAYIDFKGNLNMKLKMKQYNLLMKLAEFFTITVKGTLLNPSYTFSNQIDVDD